MTDVLYSQVTDLLYGDMIVSPATQLKHVTNASQEVDSKLGFQYETPFTVLNVSRPGWLLIHRIANNLASGRLILEVDQSGEESTIHKYGQSLIDEANGAIKLILDGDINLNPTDDNDTGGTVLPSGKGPRVTNLDPYSVVESFYGWAARPSVSPVRVSPDYTTDGYWR